MCAKELVLGVDVGGTFTDAIAGGAGGELIAHKILSTPDDYVMAIRSAIEFLSAGAGVSPGALVHGTTLVSNILVTRGGAKVGMLTTRGFRDVLELGRIRRPDMYDVFWRRPQPLISRDLRMEIDERMDSSGCVLRPLPEQQVIDAAKLLLREGCTSIVIGFLNSYKNPQHEQHAARLINKSFENVRVWCSGVLLPEMREFERISTAVVTAYVAEVVEAYLARLVSEWKEATGRQDGVRIVQANGGQASIDAIAEFPARMIESGPAAGALVAARLAAELGLEEAVSFDMGGTTAKSCVVKDGRVNEARELYVGSSMLQPSRLMSGDGYPVRMPCVDLVEIGAGGGSIVWLDEAMGMHVGPDSAGAQPGPVCYARGGADPTLTDCYAVLGFLSGSGRLAGELRIDADAARSSVGARLANPLGITPEEAAWGAFTIATAAMGGAAKASVFDAGVDARRAPLVVFGGAGPMHSCALVGDTGAPSAVVPLKAGVFSAVGLLTSDSVEDYIETVGLKLPLDPAAAGRINVTEIFSNVELRARDRIRPLDPEGIGWWAHCKYEGQRESIPVEIPRGVAIDGSYVIAAFKGRHHELFSYTPDELQVELFDAHVRFTRKSEFPLRDALSATWQAVQQRGLEQATNPETRDIYLGPDSGWMVAPVAGRHELTREPRSGPFLVQDDDTTVLILPGYEAAVDELGTLHIVPRR